MIDIFILFSSIVGLIGISREAYDVIKTHSLKISNLFFIMYSITYGVQLAYFLYSYEYNKATIPYIKNNLGVLFLWHLLAIIGYFILKFFSSQVKKKQKRNIYTSKDVNALQFSAVVSLIIGIICLHLWSSAYGGIFPLILIGDAVRAGYGNVNSIMTIFMRPASILMFTTLLFITLLRCKKSGRVFNYLCVFISFTYSLLYLLAADGRFTTAMYFLLVFFASFNVFEINQFTKKKLVRVFVVSICALLFIFSLDTITDSLRDKDANDLSDHNFILSEFDYIYQTGVHIINKVMDYNGSWLLFHDILGGVFAWFPIRYKPESIIGIWDYNTKDIAGEFATGQIPTDFVSTSLYDASFLGIIIFGVFWGLMLKRMESVKYNCHIFSEPLYCYFSYLMIRLPNYTVLSDPVGNMFPVFITYVIYRIICGRNYKKSLAK